jgi:hypothetical protein
MKHDSLVFYPSLETGSVDPFRLNKVREKVGSVSSGRCKRSQGGVGDGIRRPTASELRHFPNTAHRYSRSHVGYKIQTVLPIPQLQSCNLHIA